MAYTPTNWKDRDVENPRTYTARQNEDGSITFFDAPGTINEAGTPVNAVNMNKIEEQLYKNDLERKITNCITEIPQDIKLELNNGTLTLKAGSKVYVPNGAGKFDVVNVSSDITRTETTNGQYYLVLNPADNYLNRGALPATSGTTAPSSTTIGILWYDTTNNVIKRLSSSGLWSSMSLPLCIYTVSNGAISSIDQVFNGFGYIGSTVFALPGVKGLIPNGRNEDGSLKNVEFTLDSVKTVNVVANQTNYSFVLNSDGIYSLSTYQEVNVPVSGYVNYVASENKIYNGVNQRFWAYVASYSSGANGVITSFQTKLPFRAADDQEVVKTSGDQTIGGVKTFTSDPYAIASQPNYYLQMLDYDNSTTPTATKAGALTILDKNKNIAGRMGFWTGSDGSKSMRFITFDGQGNNTQLQVGFKSNGSVYTTCPTPEAASNTNTIATTAWVRNYVKNTGGGANWASKVSVARDTNYTAPSNGYIAASMQFDDASGTLTINNVQIFTASGNVQSPSFTFVPVSKGDVVKLSGGAWVTAYFVPFK